MLLTCLPDDAIGQRNMFPAGMGKGVAHGPEKGSSGFGNDSLFLAIGRRGRLCSCEIVAFRFRYTLSRPVLRKGSEVDSRNSRSSVQYPFLVPLGSCNRTHFKARKDCWPPT